jgi:SAM-dependent methyltransferase
MRAEPNDLQQFYASRQGQLARRLLSMQIRQLWPNLTGKTVVGLGYALPFMGALDEAERLITLLPHTLPGVPPADAAGRTGIVAECDLPLPDASVDHLLLVHAFETSPALRRLMREVWRVLADGGRMIALVPNRRGLWCWSERTPFGHGQPYSLGQLERTLRQHLLEPVASRNALYLPPTESSLLLRFAIPAERIGLRLAPQLSGVVLVEAEKQVLIPARAAPKVEPVRRRRYAVAPQSALAARTGATGSDL